jgi:hypothetical protein
MNKNSRQDPVDSTGNMSSDSEEIPVLDALATRDAQIRRQLYAQEGDRNHKFIRSLIEVIPDAAATLGRLHDALIFAPEVAGYVLSDPAIAHQQHLLDMHLTMASGGLMVKGAPYDFDWRAVRDHGYPDADRTTGMIEVATSSIAPPPSQWNGAGIGVLFRPRARSTYVRVAPYLRYGYRWQDDSTLEVARNRGELRVLVRERDSGTIVVDRPARLLWNDGTSWYQTHSDEQDDVYSDSTYFFASSDHEYSVWFWFNSSVDFNHTEGAFDFGSSRASNSLGARLVFVVFEQWT